MVVHLAEPTVANWDGWMVASSVVRLAEQWAVDSAVNLDDSMVAHWADVTVESLVGSKAVKWALY